ncbi:MAG: GNAT family N-acetyltransferase [Marinilabiliaceae bacterium]|jgi:ribosomal protein S18 acetylase RimI-like enzyme|nr:GNAT family N-acetyltransferase [Marinilabiliaceae bacterium]
MIIYRIFNTNNVINALEKESIIRFLYKHLGEYGDSLADIQKSIDFALKVSNPGLATISLGGFVLAAYEEREIIGAVVINRTGMSGYIPGHILVYIAVHKDHRGKGLGKELMQKVIDITKDDIALHVEPDNPAVNLYEKLGFENKYLEMRYSSAK